MIVVVFYGECKTQPQDHSGFNMWGVLLVLSVLAAGGGWFGLDPVSGVLPDGGLDATGHGGALPWITAAVPLAGLVVGYLVFVAKVVDLEALSRRRLAAGWRSFWVGGWGFDRLYAVLFVEPFKLLARWNKRDVVDAVYGALVWLARRGHGLFARTQTGELRWYAANMAAALLFVIVLVLVS
jgi:NADH-quinone oxidoreductase subunit L